MRVVTVVGTRPQLIKAAALQSALRAQHNEVFVDTGQHYDLDMAGHFFAELGLARPDHQLGIAGGGHASQTGRMLIALEPVLKMERPEAVIVFGDTNSTVAGALAAAKLGIPVAHVEAGLRSFDRAMPEELNRILADHLSTWLFAPTLAAVSNLAAEGIYRGVAQVGDLMQDLAAGVTEEIRNPTNVANITAQLRGRGIPEGAELQPGRYLFATVHRAENRTHSAISAWTALLDRVAAAERPVILSLHPGTRLALRESGCRLGRDVWIVDPLGYRSSLTLQLHSAAVLTDSGGIQREAAWLGVPCLILRRRTEWVEMMLDPRATSTLVGLDADYAVQEVNRLAPSEGAPLLALDRSRKVQVPAPGAAAAIAYAVAELPARI